MRICRCQDGLKRNLIKNGEIHGATWQLQMFLLGAKTGFLANKPELPVAPCSIVFTYFYPKAFENMVPDSNVLVSFTTCSSSDTTGGHVLQELASLGLRAHGQNVQAAASTQLDFAMERDMGEAAAKMLLFCINIYDSGFSA